MAYLPWSCCSVAQSIFLAFDQMTAPGSFLGNKAYFVSDPSDRRFVPVLARGAKFMRDGKAIIFSGTRDSCLTRSLYANRYPLRSKTR